jgi:hypothetical protein
MPPPESEIAAARLARMKALVDALEKACADSDEQHENFLKLRAELQAARDALKLYPPPGSDKK